MQIKFPACYHARFSYSGFNQVRVTLRLTSKRGTKHDHQNAASNPKLMQTPIVALSDEELLKQIFAALSNSVSAVADPYSDDGSYAAAIATLPIGLRAMAATHHLDISLTMDDIGWHFLNFGEPNLVRDRSWAPRTRSRRYCGIFCGGALHR